MKLKLLLTLLSLLFFGNAKSSENEKAKSEPLKVIQKTENGPRLTGFTLVNADTDTDIMAIEDGAKLNYDELKDLNLSIRANHQDCDVGYTVQLRSGVLRFQPVDYRRRYSLQPVRGYRRGLRRGANTGCPFRGLYGGGNPLRNGHVPVGGDRRSAGRFPYGVLR